MRKAKLKFELITSKIRYIYSYTDFKINTFPILIALNKIILY